MTRPDEIKDGVRETYDLIAPHFAPTRDKVWPPTRELIRDLAPCRVGDLGCGTGILAIAAIIGRLIEFPNLLGLSKDRQILDQGPG